MRPAVPTLFKLAGALDEVWLASCQRQELFRAVAACAWHLFVKISRVMFLYGRDGNSAPKHRLDLSHQSLVDVTNVVEMLR
jgi:hypothetical protein